MLVPQLLALSLLAAGAAAAPKPHRIAVQAHRGGLGYQPESTLYAFKHALELGVDTLEFDVVFTADRIPVVWHDHHITASKCRDTDPSAQHVGALVRSLTLAQLKTLDCGSLQPAAHPQQHPQPGARIPTLAELLELLACAGARDVTLNLETKLDPEHPGETWGVETYVRELVPVLERYGVARRTTVQSFDWRTLEGIRGRWPGMRTVALVDDTTVVPGGNGTYPWLGGVDLAEYGGSWVRAAKAVGAGTVSPVHGTPSGKSVVTPGYEEFTTREVVREARRLGMGVVPWTVNDEATIEKLIRDGVEAIISDYPERVMFVARKMGVQVGRRGVKVPQRCMAKAGRL